jgi:hypothetical protein
MPVALQEHDVPEVGKGRFHRFAGDGPEAFGHLEQPFDGAYEVFVLLVVPPRAFQLREVDLADRLVACTGGCIVFRVKVRSHPPQIERFARGRFHDTHFQDERSLRHDCSPW